MLTRNKLLKWLVNDDKDEYGNPVYQAVKYYQAIFGTDKIAHYIRKYGEQIFKAHFTNSWGVTSYGFPLRTNLIRSHYHMKDIAKNQIQNANRYSLSTVAKHQLMHERYHIGFYTILISGAVDMINKYGLWIDGNNHHYIYKLLNKFHQRLSQQIRSNKRFRHVIFIAGDTENPWSLSGHHRCYSHGHNHGLVGISANDKTVVAELNSVAQKDFYAIFGYPLVKPHRKLTGLAKAIADKSFSPVQPLTYSTGHGSHTRTHHAVISSVHGRSKQNHFSMIAVNKFIKYMDTDYRIQTKDVDFSDFMELSLRQRHILIDTQLNSVYNMRTNRGLSKRTADNAKAEYDNYKYFVADNRWTMGLKHVTSIQQWSIAQGKRPYAKSDNHLAQLDIFSNSEPNKRVNELLKNLIHTLEVTLVKELQIKCDNRNSKKALLGIQSQQGIIQIETTIQQLQIGRFKPT